MQAEKITDKHRMNEKILYLKKKNHFCTGG